MIIFEIILTVLITDFVSGFFHWLEDAYGGPEWPLVGCLIVKPNILHHHDPRYFTRHSWFHSSWLLLCIVMVIVGIAWLFGVLTWHTWLFAALGANANQVHKWSHRSPAENYAIISLLQRVRILQTPRHHAGHHTDPKNSHYCVLTNLLNPILDAIRLWQCLEAAVHLCLGVRRRLDTSIDDAAALLSK